VKTETSKQASTEKRVDHSRRTFAAGLAAGMCLPWSATRGSSKIVYPDRVLLLNNVHTGEKENITFWSDGHYVESGLNRVNWLLRDFRTGDVKAIDPRLMNILYLLTKRVETNKPVLIRMPKIKSVDVQKVALTLGGGGVGYYPSSNFVHLDTGPVRTW